MKIEREKIRKQQFTIVVCMGIFVALTMLWGGFRAAIDQGTGARADACGISEVLHEEDVACGG